MKPELKRQLHGSELPASEITGESAYLQFNHLRRRGLLEASLGLSTLAFGVTASAQAPAQQGGLSKPATPSDAFAQLKKPSVFQTVEALTTFEDATRYNNFYEFGLGKDDPYKYAGKLKPAPWHVNVAGECELKGRFALEDLLKGPALEERIYRHRCVEAWSMVLPWAGVSLADVLKKFKPTSRAKYVAFTTLQDPAQMPNQRSDDLRWPYREGLRIDEAMNPLSFLATGLYGRALPNQNGAPLRLILPWKYGFKGIKSIVRIEFTETQPFTSWSDSIPEEYGFYANVNPEVEHPRWSQASERRIAGTGSSLFKVKRIPTQKFNGYQAFVAPIYQGMDLASNY